MKISLFNLSIWCKCKKVFKCEACPSSSSSSQSYVLQASSVCRRTFVYILYTLECFCLASDLYTFISLKCCASWPCFHVGKIKELGGTTCPDIIYSRRSLFGGILSFHLRTWVHFVLGMTNYDCICNIYYTCSYTFMS